MKKIFIAYAREDQDIAERVAHALRGRKAYDVFFDEAELRAATNYDVRIREAIETSDLMVFLISPDSVASGRFPLTELRIAREKWPSARGRVLPVMIRPTPDEEVPNYLGAVVILKPEGNAAAEIALNVDRLLSRVRRRTRVVMALLLPLVAIVIATIWWRGLFERDPWDELPRPALEMGPEPNESVEPVEQAVQGPEVLVPNATRVAWEGSAFLVLAGGPDRIVRVAEDGELMAERLLDGAPLSLSVGELGVFVGLAPRSIVRLDPEGLQRMGDGIVVDLPDNMFGEPVSSTPAELAQDGVRLWAIGRGGASANGLGVLDPDSMEIVVPSYYEDVSFDLPGLKLRDGAGGVWSGTNDTTPASVVQFRLGTVVEFGGHDYEVAACASDVLPMGGGLLLVPDCQGNVVEVEVAGDDLYHRRTLGRVVGHRDDVSWSTTLLGRSAGEHAAVVTAWNGPEDDLETVVGTLRDGESRERLRRSGRRVVDMAVGRSVALLVLESQDGVTELRSVVVE